MGYHSLLPSDHPILDHWRVFLTFQFSCWFSVYWKNYVFWRPVSSLYWATKLYLVNVEWNLKTFLSLLLPMPWWTPAFLLEKTLVPEGNLFFCPAPSFRHTAQVWWVVWGRSTKELMGVCRITLWLGLLKFWPIMSVHMQPRNVHSKTGQFLINPFMVSSHPFAPYLQQLKQLWDSSLLEMAYIFLDLVILVFFEPSELRWI